MPIKMDLLTKSGKWILPDSAANIFYRNLFDSTHKQYQSLNAANTTETLWFENHKILNAKCITDEAISLFLKQLLIVQYVPTVLGNCFISDPCYKYYESVLFNN